VTVYLEPLSLWVPDSAAAAVAINLLRLSYWRPSRIVLVDRAPRNGFAVLPTPERSHPYLLNVPRGAQCP